MKLSAWLALPAILTAVACAQPASAAVVTYTYTGHIDTGFDGIGLFGGGSLNGLAFTAVFSRDDDLAEDIFLGKENSYVRGAQAVTATLKINDITIDIGGGNSEQSQYDDADFEGFFHQAAGPLGSFSLGATTLGTFAPLKTGYIPGPDYHTLPSLSAEDTPGLSWFGRFDFGAPDPNNPSAGLFTNGQFRPETIVVDGATVPGGVPEPGAWALMILGFGAAGHALRRQRRLLAA